MAIQTETHSDILHPNASRPETLISSQDAVVQTGGPTWQGRFQPSAEQDIPLLALTGATSWAQVAWSKPTTILGVQFCGDSNDGWARILVDGQVVWSGNTYGGEHKFNEYIQISGLPSKAHTIRVEPTGKAGADEGNIHVTLTAFGWGAVAPENRLQSENQIFVPFFTQ